MQVAILDANYPSQKFFGLAATWLKWEAQKNCVDVVGVDSADVVLMTVSSQQGVASVRSLRKKIPKGKPLILGGGGCWAPFIFEGLADVVCVGEGARFIETLFTMGLESVFSLPESYYPGKKDSIIPGDSFPWACPPLLHPDGTVRVWGARGCKRKCLFCQTGWERSYLPHPYPSWVKQQISHLKRQNKKVSVITNDGATSDLLAALGQQEFVSATLHNLKNINLTRDKAKSVRIGVEGVSARIRDAVKKPVSNEDLVNFTHRCWRNGVGVRWFFVCGLPGETDADWLELRELVSEVSCAQKGVVMMNFHAFIPQPATPLSVFPLRDEYWERFEEFRRWFFHGPGFSRRIQIVAPAQYPGRLKRAMESMAAGESELRRGWFENENRNWQVKYLAGPAQLRSIANRYAELIQ